MTSESDRKEIARRHLDATEAWLRRVIDRLMMQKFGESYLSPGESGSCPSISSQTRRDIAARYESDPSRFPRRIDAADLGHAIKIVLHPALYPSIFKPTLEHAFPDGVDEARTFLVRLEDIRNKLAHGGTCSDRDLERCVCYSGDIVDSLKTYFKEANLEQEFNVPTFIRMVDNRGNAFHFGPPRGVHLFVDLISTGTGILRYGDQLTIEVEVDPTFTDCSVKWLSFKGEHGTGCIYSVMLDHMHVGNSLDIRFEVSSKEPWHRLSECDDMLDIRYRVLPPLDNG